MRVGRSGWERASAAVYGLCLAVAAVSCGGGGGAGAPVPGAAVPVVAVVPEADATATGLAVVIPGSGWEDEGSSGLTLLSALAAVEEITPEVEGLGGELGVSCGRWALVVTLVAPPETWRRAAAELSRALAGSDPGPASLERARGRLASMLALDRGNPSWQARVAASRALYGEAGGGGNWSGPACGVAEALDLFGSSSVSGMAERLGSFRSVAATGAPGVSADSALRSLFRVRSAVPFPVPGPPVPGRVYVERNTVTAWLAVAWPFGSSADVDAVRLVGALLEEEIGPDLTRPGVLYAASDVELHGEGGALVVTAVVAPPDAAKVASTLDSAVARLSAGAGSPAVLERVARRHRGERLRALATPESRAARVALDRARGGARRPWPERASYTPEAVRSAAAGLGLPARAVVGPGAARGAAVP